MVTKDRMVSKKKDGCILYRGSKRCTCYEAHDSKGRKKERRLTKRRERQEWKHEVLVTKGFG